MVDAADSKSAVERHAGSSPATRTIFLSHGSSLRSRLRRGAGKPAAGGRPCGFETASREAPSTYAAADQPCAFHELGIRPCGEAEKEAALLRVVMEHLAQR